MQIVLTIPWNNILLSPGKIDRSKKILQQWKKLQMENHHAGHTCPRSLLRTLLAITG